MGEIVNFSDSNNVENKVADIINITDEMLADARIDYSKQRVLSVPIADLGALGTGVSSLIPAFRTITVTSTLEASGLYKVANAAVGDTLKLAKDGTFWGALKTVSGDSKMGKFVPVDQIGVANQITLPINPAFMMMAVTLFSIEQQLSRIEETEQKILSFLEAEKKAEIEADVETLCNILHQYKLNWDNEHFVAGNHKLALDIQRNARKNMRFYHKEIKDSIGSKKIVVMTQQMKKPFSEMLKNFKYYRLSLYTYAMASFIEMLLSGNFKEGYIQGVKSEIETLTLDYHDILEECSMYLEKAGKATADLNILKKIGQAGVNAGKVIGSIPLIKEGPVDEFLQDKGAALNKNALKKQLEEVEDLAKLRDPETRVYTDQMRKLIQIFNKTTDIYFDDKQIYLVTG